MATKCVLCGAPIDQGIVCTKCDPPRKRDTKSNVIKPPEPGARALQTAVDPFPKAPVLPFPVEATSVAATSICEILSAARVPALLVNADGSIRFVSAEGKQLPGLGLPSPSLGSMEQAIGFRIPDLRKQFSAPVHIGKRLYEFSLIPLAGGAGGAVLIFRPHPSESLHIAYVTYLREAVLTPLRALREALNAGARNRGSDPLLQDSAATLDQILSSLELAPVISDEGGAASSLVEPVRPMLERLNDRFAPLAELQGITFQVDAALTQEVFSDISGLESALSILLENSLHYVQEEGQIVLGMRSLEHKGRPLLLFFVMDNGPLVPEELRDTIFSDDFLWNSNDGQRTGHGLAQVRKFAMAHGGQVWIESRSGKACTFFLRVRPRS